MGANPPSSPTRTVLPHDSQGGPKLSDISKRRESIVCSTDGGEWRIVDRWGDKETPQDLPHEWTGSTKFRKSWGVSSEQTQPLQQRSRVGSAFIGTPMRDTASHFEEEAKFEIDLRAEGDILDLRPTSQQGKRWDFRNQKDQRGILWLIRKKRPKLVIGYGKSILFCTVLYHEQIRRGAWFLHDFSGNAFAALSLSYVMRLECRHDVFHGNARDRRDGEQVSFLTNSPHFARKVVSTNRRENLDSEIREVFGNRLATQTTHPPRCTWQVEHKSGPST